MEVLISFSIVKDELRAAASQGRIDDDQLTQIQKQVDELARVIELKLAGHPIFTTQWIPEPIKNLQGQDHEVPDEDQWMMIKNQVNSISLKITESSRKSMFFDMDKLLSTGVFADLRARYPLSHPWFDRVRTILTRAINSSHESLRGLTGRPGDDPPLVLAVLMQNKVIQDVANYIGLNPYFASEFWDILFRCNMNCNFQIKIIRSVVDGAIDALEWANDSREIVDSISNDFETLKMDQEKRLDGLKDFEQMVGDWDMQSSNILPELNIRRGELRRTDLNSLLTSKPWCIQSFTGDLGDDSPRVVRTNRNGHQYAVKIFPDDKTEVRICVRILREVKAMQSLDHHRIIDLAGIWTIENKYPAIVTKWCNGGNLFDFVKTRRTPLGTKLRLMLEVAEALQYLHNRQPSMVHGDVKCSNVFVHDGHAVLADFGLSRARAQPHCFTTSGGSYTDDWRAPEIIIAMESTSPIPRGMIFANPLTDMYSFGCSVLEIMIEFYPKGLSEESVKLMPVTPPVQVSIMTPADAPRGNNFVSREEYDHELDQARTNLVPLPIVKEHWDFMVRFWDRSPWVRPTADEAVTGLVKLCEDEKEFQAGLQSP